MSINLVSAERMREIDRITIQERNVAGSELMERAGAAVAKLVLESCQPSVVGIVAGKGNNAGDGFVAARLLAMAGVRVKLLMLIQDNNLSQSCREMFEKLQDTEDAGAEKLEVFDKFHAAEIVEIFADCDLVVDAMLGTGITGPARGTYGEVIALLNEMDQPVLAVDIPSGLNADTGFAEGACVIAAATVVMGLPKIGCVIGDGSTYCGDLIVEDLGFPEDLLESPDIFTHLLELKDARQSLPKRPKDGHKGTFGSLMVIAGSGGLSGAAYLTAMAGLRSGCGLLYTAFPERVSEILESQLIEAIKIAIPGAKGDHLTHESWTTLEPWLEKSAAIALGPGLGTHPDTSRLIDELVCQEIPMVIDADALNCLGEKTHYLTQRKAPTVLTPHPGEMARLMGLSTAQVQADRFGCAAKLAAEAQAVVVLKGASTLVATPEGHVYVNPTGNSGMAKGGSGDILTGLIGGFLAQGCSAVGAACTGVYLHGLAGDSAREKLGERGMIARDILTFLPEVLRLCEDHHLPVDSA